MKTSLLILFAVVFTTLPRAAAAQTGAGGVEHFSKEELSFDKPAGWGVEDRSDERARRFVLKRPGGAALIEVALLRDAGATPEQRQAAEDKFMGASVEEMVRRLAVEQAPPQRDYQCPRFGPRPGWGVRLSGLFDGRPAKGEIYAMAAGERYLNVSFLTAEQAEVEATAAWKTVLETLKVAGDDGVPQGRVVGLVAPGRALSKPQPAYPRELKKARVSGPVAVDILVDEKGDVARARAISGEPALYAAAEAAAMHAKFTPTTVCGRAVKVSGVINYNFILR